MEFQSICEYAQQHDLDPADLLAIMLSDDDDTIPTEPSPITRLIHLSDGTYGDTHRWPVEYLDTIADCLTA